MDHATILLQQAPFDRSTVVMLHRVLEEAWLLIGSRFKGPLAEKIGRMNIADGILALAKAGQRNPDVLKSYAVSRARNLLGPAGQHSPN